VKDWQQHFKNYFRDQSAEWLVDGYETDGYNFPTAAARNKRTISILADEFPENDATVVDLGCGGGDLSRKLASLGYRVTGVDRERSMIDTAEIALDQLPIHERRLLSLVHRDVLDNGLTAQSAEAVTSLGLIGYLDDDDSLFIEADRLLRPGGLFIVSCRNRLFNMTSITRRTIKEIDQGDAHQLASEIMELSKTIPSNDASNFLQEVAQISPAMDVLPQGTYTVPPSPSNAVEARQQTPGSLRTTADSYGFELVNYYGINPHLLPPSIARSLPPYIYNQLSSTLESLSHLPISLTWSSVFIGVFRKKSV